MKRRPKTASPKRPSSRRSEARSTNNLRVAFTEKQIQNRVRALADQINRDYQGRVVHVVGILENSFMFIADLLRALKGAVICHFIRVEMRDRVQDGIAIRELMYTPKVSVTGKDVLLVDGVLQSGLTQDHLYRYILGQGPASLRTATLLEKTEERKVDVATDYMGFKTSARFLVGYGLGYQEKFRNLPYIAMLP